MLPTVPVGKPIQAAVLDKMMGGLSTRNHAPQTKGASIPKIRQIEFVILHPGMLASCGPAAPRLSIRGWQSKYK
jgi:hypothetical protein